MAAKMTAKKKAASRKRTTTREIWATEYVTGKMLTGRCYESEHLALHAVEEHNSNPRRPRIAAKGPFALLEREGQE